MTHPNWEKLTLIEIPSKPKGLWHPTGEYIAGAKLLRLTVVDKNQAGQNVATTWKPTARRECGPDGMPTPATTPGLLVATAPYGALVAKIGGGSADQPDTSPTATNAYPGRKVFAVGSYCIASVTKDESGPLFLTMND